MDKRHHNTEWLWNDCVSFRRQVDLSMGFEDLKINLDFGGFALKVYYMFGSLTPIE